MQFVLQTRSPIGRSVIPLSPQGSLVVGRSAPADIILDDPMISRTHLTLTHSRGMVRVTDTGSTNGTLINGFRVREGWLQFGDVIGVGTSSLRLSIALEGTVAKPFFVGPPAGLTSWQHKLTDLIQKSCSFALVDGAADPALLELLKASGTFFQSLYEGESASDIAPFGPYLIDLDTAPNFIAYLIQAGWGKAWGMYIRTKQNFHALRHHLRTLLLVNIGGEQNIFRFYDPRVLPVFLNTATQKQKIAIFGSIESFVLETFPRNRVLMLSAEEQTSTEIPFS